MKSSYINEALKQIANNLIIQQLQIQALVSLLSKDKQIEWLNIVNDLCKKRDIDPATGEPPNIHSHNYCANHDCKVCNDRYKNELNTINNINAHKEAIANDI